MEKLVSSWFNNKSLPDSYIFPPDMRPGKRAFAPVLAVVPVIDLSGDRAATVEQMMEASRELGFFQVVNHGIAEELVRESGKVLREVFEMGEEDKARLCNSEDPKIRSCKLYTSSYNYDKEEFHFWRDNLKHPCLPNLEDCIEHWPQKPARYREVIGAYAVEVKKLGSRILELICEGLGLESDYLGGKLSEVVNLSVNHYPPCPDPTLTLGLARHCDPNTITILHQGDVYGLQVLKDGEWIGVDPLPNAFVINIGHQLQVISNNKVRSAMHRVVTNASLARTTAAFFFNPCDDSVIEPAKQVVDAAHPPLYTTFHYRDFLLNFMSVAGNPEATLDPFKLV